MAEGNSRLWKILTAIAATLGALGVVGLIVMYGDVQVVKAQSNAAAAKEEKQDKILEKIPAIEKGVSNIDATLIRIEGKLDIIEKNDKELAVEDAKFHHRH